VLLFNDVDLHMTFHMLITNVSSLLQVGCFPTMWQKQMH